MVDKIDSLDLDIIDLMREDGRITIQEMAKRLEKRRATIHARINKLEEKGVIKGYTVIPDFAQLDLGITVFVLVALHYSEFREVDSPESMNVKILSLPYVTEVYNVSGEFDFLLKIRINNLESLGATVIFNLRKLIGVSRTLTLATFTTEKEELSNHDLKIQGSVN